MSRPAGSSGVASPCVSLCRMSPQTGWCEGCWRSIDEIAGWSRMNDERRREVWASLPLRRAQAGAAEQVKPAEGQGCGG